MTNCYVTDPSIDRSFQIITDQCPTSIVRATYPVDYISPDAMEFSYRAFQFRENSGDTTAETLSCDVTICDYHDFAAAANVCNTSPSCDDGFIFGK